MNYNLELTNKQSYLIQFHIYDLCNWRLTKSKFSEYDTSTWDKYDIFRASIYYKERRLNKNRCIIEGITKAELMFIGHEILHWVVESHAESDDRNEKVIGKNLIDKINKMLDTKYQRNRKLELIGI